MSLIYRNFDGLDVSFQGALPRPVVDELEKAREAAQSARQPVFVTLGTIGGEVADTGARGGYAFRFDTGAAGAVWFFARSDDPKRWNIRVSVKSLALALDGYQATKAKLWATLDDLGAYGASGTPLQERISRLDYCMDFALGDFQPDIAGFVCHSRTAVRSHDKESERRIVRRGRRIESVRAGEMPGRQVALYDKIAEIKQHSKSYWWDLWGLDPSSFEGDIWRVEPRLGKRELDEWNIRNFSDLEACAGDALVAALRVIRYTVPSQDRNRSRWPLHPLWQEALATASHALAPYISKADRGKVLTGLREQHIAMRRKNIAGNVIGLTAAMELDVSEMAETLDQISAYIAESVRNDKTVVIRKHRKAVDKMEMLR